VLTNFIQRLEIIKDILKKDLHEGKSEVQ
jgi:hypothetical protein